MPIFNEKSVGEYHLKAIFPKIVLDDAGIPYVQWWVSDEIEQQCKRRSEAAKRGWETRRSKQQSPHHQSDDRQC
jgi:hypothetical protein